MAKLNLRKSRRLPQWKIKQLLKKRRKRLAAQERLQEWLKGLYPTIPDPAPTDPPSNPPSNPPSRSRSHLDWDLKQDTKG